MTRLEKALGISALSLVAVGCEPHESANLATDELEVSVEAQALRSGSTHVLVKLQNDQGSIRDVKLSPEDLLLAQMGRQVVELARTERDGGVWYEGKLLGNAQGSAIEVRLERERHENASARVTLPSFVQVTAPIGDVTAFFQDQLRDVEVRWTTTRPGDDVELSYDAHCGTMHTEDTTYVNDTGHTQLDLSFDHANTDCDIELTVKRRIAGTLDGDWEGAIHGTSADVVEFEID